ncbi:T9SS type A sorting domain-containing protein [Gynurincola endophyticus]|uniref:T9SS type A sorting domain-containing protein n=1 Tax=Gynurincola endophyticus TaxID=2479004 RepID=UPI000F8F5AA0|nr:T9SS type A sorting domain-containing protein [Gynurincola endophyticus]
MKPYYWFSIILFINLLCVNELQARIRYVTTTGAGSQNGTSWSNAYNNLQTAITAATAGDTIWVRAGTYVPTTTLTSGRTGVLLYFGLNKSIKIFGGFAGNETSFSQRNWINNKTILSGDTNGNDNNNIAVNLNTNRSDNKKRIFIITGNINGAELDGFVIRNSYAPTNNTSLSYSGTSIGSEYDNFVVASCTGLTLRNLEFTRNYSNNCGGLNIISSTVQLDNIRFYDNISNTVGNAFRSSTVNAQNIFIRKQVSSTFASGLSIYNTNGSAENVYIDSCTSSNYGILDIYQSNFNINRLELTRNSSGSYGPFSIETSTSRVANVLIHNNTITGATTGINMLASNNGASGANNVIIVNTTITKNIYSGNGTKYAIYNHANNSSHNQVRLFNTILYQPSVLNYNNNFTATANNYTNTALNSVSNLGNNLVSTASPFTNYNANDFMLPLNSDARNAADSTRLTTTLGITNLTGELDVYGKKRVNQNGRLDIGAIEDTLIDVLLRSGKYHFAVKQQDRNASINIELKDHPFQTAILKAGTDNSNLYQLNEFDIKDHTHFKHQTLVDPNTYTYFELWGVEPNAHKVLIGIQKIKPANLITLKVYPNPASHQLQVNTGNSKINRLIIYDLNGRVIKNIQVSTNQTVHMVSITDLKPGSYWLNAVGEESSNSTQFIKQ